MISFSVSRGKREWLVTWNLLFQICLFHSNRDRVHPFVYRHNNEESNSLDLQHDPRKKLLNNCLYSSTVMIPLGTTSFYNSSFIKKIYQFLVHIHLHIDTGFQKRNNFLNWFNVGQRLNKCYRNHEKESKTNEDTNH